MIFGRLFDAEKEERKKEKQNEKIIKGDKRENKKIIISLKEQVIFGKIIISSLKVMFIKIETLLNILIKLNHT